MKPYPGRGAVSLTKSIERIIRRRHEENYAGIFKLLPFGGMQY